MIIVAFLFLIGTLGLFISRKNLKTYQVIACFLISSVYFFYTPPQADDLFRYYNLFDIVKGLSLSQLLRSQFTVSDWLYNYLLTDYMRNSKTFMAILFVLSRTGIKQLLPVFFSLLTYIPLVLVISDIGKTQRYSRESMCICFGVMLACIDLRFLSMLRNMAAYSVFVSLLYVDLVKEKKRFLCFIGYIVMCELHMSCVLLLAIRLVVMIANKRFQYIIILIMLSLFIFTEQIADIINAFFGNIGFLSRLAQRMIDYNIGRTSYNTHGAIFFVGSIFVCIIFYLLIKDRKRVKTRYQLYGKVYVYFCAYTAGSILQYDVLTRSCQLIAMMCLPYIMAFANDITINCYSITVSEGENRRICDNQVLFILLLFLIAFSYAFYGMFSYVPLQRGLRLF